MSVLQRGARRGSGLAGLAAAAACAGALLAAAQLDSVAVLLVVVMLQVALLVCSLVGTPPATATGVLVVSALTAAAADIVSATVRHPSLAPLAAVVGLAVLATFVAQLARGIERARVTEAMASTLALAAATVALAVFVVLFRLPEGRVVVTAAAAGGGAAVFASRSAALFADAISGALASVVGTVVGIVVGAGVTVAYAAAARSLTVADGVVLGLVVAVVAAFADLGARYAAGSSRFAPLLGPVAALTAVAPVAYLVGVLVAG